MIKFSIQIENQFGYSWQQIKEVVEKTEQNDYHSFYICDHFFLNNNSEDRNALEAWTVLTAVAMITNRIRLGTLVSGNNYRNPALLAKIAASLDVISEGRMEFGIGAGWKQNEYEAYGFTFPSLADRMAMLEEALQIIRSLWSQTRTTFDGVHYQIKNAVFAPKPVQNLPLIMIGGSGEKKLLKLVARYGDYMNLPFTPMHQIDQKLESLKKHCKAVGRDYEEIGKSIFVPMWVGEDEQAVDKYLIERAQRRNISVDNVKKQIFDDYPGSWIGTAQQIRDRIEYLNGKGFDYYFIQQPFDLSTDQIDKFANLVMKPYFT